MRGRDINSASLPVRLRVHVGQCLSTSASPTNIVAMASNSAADSGMNPDLENLLFNFPFGDPSSSQWVFNNEPDAIAWIEDATGGGHSAQSSAPLKRKPSRRFTVCGLRVLSTMIEN